MRLGSPKGDSCMEWGFRRRPITVPYLRINKIIAGIGLDGSIRAETCCTRSATVVRRSSQGYSLIVADSSGAAKENYAGCGLISFLG